MTGEAVPLLPGQTCLDDVLGAICTAAPAPRPAPAKAPTLVQMHVPGVPVPQGSKKAFKHRHTGRVVMTDDNPNLAAWRAMVAHVARTDWAGREPLAVPVTASLVFYLPRPAGHYGTGRNAGVLKASAPLHPTVKPDLDKLVRAVFDSLTTAGVWKDDALCWGESAWKNYADGRPPGLVLTLDWSEYADG
jgi:crossover junction endodeoxyribonuclease RusA